MPQYSEVWYGNHGPQNCSSDKETVIYVTNLKGVACHRRGLLCLSSIGFTLRKVSLLCFRCGKMNSLCNDETTNLSWICQQVHTRISLRPRDRIITGPDNFSVTRVGGKSNVYWCHCFLIHCGNPQIPACIDLHIGADLLL